MIRNPEAFAAVYEREGEQVLVFLARRTLDVELALDLTAETFALALQSWHRVRRLGPEQTRAWLFTVARRQYSRYLRRARVERRTLERLGIEVPTVQEDDLALIEARAGLDDLRRAVAEELDGLADGQRQALQLRVVQELPYPEVASALGITEPTARARVARGLKTLAAALERHRPPAKELI